jgi:hypothetical protein
MCYYARGKPTETRARDGAKIGGIRHSRMDVGETISRNAVQFAQ